MICGDINEDTIIGSVSGLFDRAGFVDVLASAGNREATHPWDTTYHNSTRWLVIEENLRRTGSDHYPIIATLEF